MLLNDGIKKFFNKLFPHMGKRNELYVSIFMTKIVFKNYISIMFCLCKLVQKNLGCLLCILLLNNSEGGLLPPA